MQYYISKGRIYRRDVSGFWVFEDNYWVHDAYDSHLDNIEAIEKDRAETLIEEMHEEGIMLYKKAKQLSRSAHKGQVDKAGNDYFYAHILPVSIMSSGRPWGQMVALLHDVLEDTKITEVELRQEFPDVVVDAVVALTKLRDESYDDFIDRVSSNKIARWVKIWDLIQNMDTDRLLEVTEKDIERVEKYRKALTKLTRQIYENTIHLYRE